MLKSRAAIIITKTDDDPMSDAELEKLNNIIARAVQDFMVMSVDKLEQRAGRNRNAGLSPIVEVEGLESDAPFSTVLDTLLKDD